MGFSSSVMSGYYRALPHIASRSASGSDCLSFVIGARVRVWWMLAAMRSAVRRTSSSDGAELCHARRRAAARIIHMTIRQVA